MRGGIPENLDIQDEERGPRCPGWGGQQKHTHHIHPHPILKAQTRDLEAAVNLLLPRGGGTWGPGRGWG